MPTADTIDFASLLVPPSCARPQDRVVRVMQMAKAIRNWLPLVRMRKDTNTGSPALIKVHFRNGFEIIVREGTHDIFTIWEVMLAGSYSSLESILSDCSAPVTVIDLGGHIGSFALRALRASPNVYVQSYEPGADNRTILCKNLELNSTAADRATVYPDAVGGVDGSAEYHMNPTNTGDSSLYGKGGGVKVSLVSFRTLLSRCKYPIAIVKIDIEGAEYDLVAKSSREDWKNVPAIMAEVHEDPSQTINGEKWLRAMYELGYTRQTKEFSTILLRRP